MQTLSFEINLCDSTLVEVIDAFVDFKRRYASNSKPTAIKGAILELYSYRAPYKGSASNFDRHLHRLLQAIGGEFNEIISNEIKINGEMIKESHHKWELCTSHTGRRSFITINVLRCPTEAEVRKCSGHASARSFERYISFGND